MQYASGKTRLKKEIANEIFKWETLISKTISPDYSRERESNVLVSLFCGGCAVETKLAPYFQEIICNDKQEYLIEMYRALQNGWLPPDTLSEDEWKYIRENKDENKALTAFAGFGCSFGGKWFDGYGRHGTKDERSKERSLCLGSKRALIRDIEILKNATFTCLDYKDVELPENCVVYADPPYKGKRAAYGIKEKFNTDEFWDYMRVISHNHRVYISELVAPDDFECIWEKSVLRQMSNCNASNLIAVEKLFVYKNSNNLK